MGWTYDKRRTTAPPASQTMTDKPTAQQAATFPNSAYLSMLGLDKKGSGIDLRAAMEAKMAALRRQIPTAEAEADRLSKGVTGTTPEQVRSEMGERMGADFSGVRFHEDAASASRAEEMGANAWTQGNDVYFGAGGFNPSVAAHELVHTVQQGAVESGINTISAPMGGVQMNPKIGEHRKSKSSATSKDETDEERIKREHIKAILAERPILESDYRRHVDHSQDDKSQDEEKSEDKKKRQPRASFYISNLDDRYFKGKMGGNAMSQVYFYKHGVYKPDEHHAEPNDPTLKDGGIKQEDDEGNSLDLRLADRNIAAKVLDNMLDTNVIVNSVKKQFIGKSQNTGKKIEAGYKKTKDFAAEGTDGIMMDYAPGVEIDRINWKGFTPQFTTTNPEYADKTSRAKNSSAWKVPVNPNPNGNKYQYHAPASIKDTNWSEIDSREGHRTIGERLDKIGEKLPGVSFAGWKKERIEARNKKGEDVSVNPGEGNELDIADPDLQRAMSNLNIIDFLMMNPDRHAGNFFINQENGKFKGLTGIDNDVSFGNGTDWTKPHGGNLGALPAAMHIDAKTAAKILGTDDDTLQKKFGEWMRQDEVDSLKERFHQMQAYIGKLQELDSKNEEQGIDKRYIVNEWNERTAMEQLEETQGQIWSDDKQSTYYQKLAGSLAIKNPKKYRQFT